MSSVTLNFYPKYLVEWSGVVFSNPILGSMFILNFLAVAGIPPLAGFYAKFAVLTTLVSAGFSYTAFILVLLSCLSCFYYIRLIKIMSFMPVKYKSQ